MAFLSPAAAASHAESWSDYEHYSLPRDSSNILRAPRLRLTVYPLGFRHDCANHASGSVLIADRQRSAEARREDDWWSIMTHEEQRGGLLAHRRNSTIFLVFL